MPVVISMLRGVNLGRHNRIKMDALRSLYISLKFRNPQTFIQSGNVIFETSENDLALLSKRIENAIHRKFGFRPDVVLRTAAELRDIVANTPFPSRRNLEPSKILVTFLADAPDAQASKALLEINCHPEEVHIRGRELYIYFPNGMARPKLAWPLIEKTLKVRGTGRNWGSVTKMLQLAESFEAATRIGQGS
jgi:uncharacterized protein (DUF1697 family)